MRANIYTLVYITSYVDYYPETHIYIQSEKPEICKKIWIYLDKYRLLIVMCEFSLSFNKIEA